VKYFIRKYFYASFTLFMIAFNISRIFSSDLSELDTIIWPVIAILLYPSIFYLTEYLEIVKKIFAVYLMAYYTFLVLGQVNMILHGSFINILTAIVSLVIVACAFVVYTTPKYVRISG
jgi:hypothetical protein